MEQELSKEMIALYGALGGAALTLIGQVINQLFAFLKEYQVARLNREDKKIEREYEKASKEKTELASILQNCLSSLGQYIQKSNAEPFRERSYHNEELTELQSSISQLSVKFIDQEMEDDFLSFIQFPSESLAIHLRSQILAFIEQHSDIGAQSIKPKHNRELAIGESCFKVLIDTDFRKKHFESTGKMLERMTEISVNLELLSPEIRELLIEVYFFGGDFRLDKNQPLYVPNGPDIRKAKKAWEANFIPNEKDAQFVLDAWYRDYKKIEASCKSQ